MIMIVFLIILYNYSKVGSKQAILQRVMLGTIQKTLLGVQAVDTVTRLRHSLLWAARTYCQILILKKLNSSNKAIKHIYGFPDTKYCNPLGGGGGLDSATP